ncbi:MAG: tetratricopeptide repeat protein [Anaerolineales bacterium]|nr:tetratricopeptide repeat protein [Anaerolineales bacterium]
MEQAIQLLEQAIQIHREIDNRFGEAVVLGELGKAYFRLQENEKAIDYHEQSLSYFRKKGLLRIAVKQAWQLGLVLANTEPERAVALMTERVEFERKAGLSDVEKLAELVAVIQARLENGVDQ